MTTQSPDRLSMGVKLVLAVLGAFLCVVGFYRWLM
jgi:hypothetical protein